MSVLDEGWYARLVDAGSSLPSRPAASGRLAFGPTEKRSQVEPHHVVIIDGRVTEAGPGLLDDADLTFLLPAADFEALWQGELDLPVAFMQGRAKLTGSSAALMDLLPLLRQPEWSEALAQAATG